MKCAVVIPIGPGHDACAESAVYSVKQAWAEHRGPFTDMVVVPVYDPNGKMGRSAARNRGMDCAEADCEWLFLMDADDTMRENAFALVELGYPATFGAVCLNGLVYRANRATTPATVMDQGPHGTLTMGCFIKSGLGVRFDETMDVGEDWDFYLRLPGWIKVTQPLVSIGYGLPSAGGPRGYESVDWLKAGAAVIERYAQGGAT